MKSKRTPVVLTPIESQLVEQFARQKLVTATARKLARAIGKLPEVEDQVAVVNYLQRAVAELSSRQADLDAPAGKVQA